MYIQLKTRLINRFIKFYIFIIELPYKISIIYSCYYVVIF